MTRSPRSAAFTRQERDPFHRVGLDRERQAIAWELCPSACVLSPVFRSHELSLARSADLKQEEVHTSSRRSRREANV
jgi:hypothetical protein